MIIRVFRAQVHLGRQEEYEQLIREEAIPGLREQDGMLAVHFGKALSSTPAEYILVTIWQDLATLQDFAGEHWQGSVPLPGEDQLVAQQSVQVYEGFEAPA